VRIRKTLIYISHYPLYIFVVRLRCTLCQHHTQKPTLIFGEGGEGVT